MEREFQEKNDSKNATDRVFNWRLRRDDDQEISDAERRVTLFDWLDMKKHYEEGFEHAINLVATDEDVFRRICQMKRFGQDIPIDNLYKNNDFLIKVHIYNEDLFFLEDDCFVEIRCPIIPRQGEFFYLRMKEYEELNDKIDKSKDRECWETYIHRGEVHSSDAHIVKWVAYDMDGGIHVALEG